MEYDAAAKPILDKMVRVCKQIADKLDPQRKDKVRIELAVDELKV